MVSLATTSLAVRFSQLIFRQEAWGKASSRVTSLEGKELELQVGLPVPSSVKPKPHPLRRRQVKACLVTELN